MDRAHDDMILSRMEIDKYEGCIPELANNHRYYQDLRGYVTDLVECYDEKVGAQKLCITKKKGIGISPNAYALSGILIMFSNIL